MWTDNRIRQATSDDDSSKQITPSDGLAIEEAKPKLKKPQLYKVLLLNDDYTPMEFVVLVLQRIFGMSKEKAVRVMLNVHQKGQGVCGLYTCEIAEAKVRMVMDFAREDNHPLQCTMEPE